MTDNCSDVEVQLPGDDGPVALTTEQIRAWAYLVSVVVTSGGYFALLIPRALSEPIDTISWVRPMLWTIGLSMAGTVLGTMVGSIIDSIRRGTDGSCDSDIRDREIGHISGRATLVVISTGFGAATILSMIDADTFWIGNTLFLFGTLSALVETVVKIRLYRRGF